MLVCNKLPKFVSTAAASDGGSLALIMREQNDKESWIVLDRKIDTKTYNRFFYEDRIVSFIEEKQLLFWLQNILEKKINSQDDLEIIEEFIEIINNR